MPGYRTSGPIGYGGIHESVKDGTSALIASPRPGSIVHGHILQENPVYLPRPRRRASVERVKVPVLSTNSTGLYVRGLQRVLNSRMQLAEPLKVDGVFGPKTRAAVLAFQKSTGLKADGIVGLKTWCGLAAAPVPVLAPELGRPLPPGQVGSSPAPSPARTPMPSAPPARAAAPPKRGVPEWGLEERLGYVLPKSLESKYMGPALANQARGMFTGEGLVMLVGTFALMVAGQFLGYGEAIDAVLVGIGWYYLGMAAFDVMKLFINCLTLTATAHDERELDKAAEDLAQALSIIATAIAIAAFFAALRIGMRKVRGGGGGLKEGGSKGETTKGESTGKSESTTKSSESTEGEPEEKAPEEKPKESAKEKLAKQRERNRQALLKKRIEEAEANGKLDKLDPADRDWLNDDPTGRRKELAYDPDTGSFKPQEAKAALQAEQDGTLKAPVRRAFDDSGQSGGGDYIDGDNQVWDVKDGSAGADAIADVAAPKGGQPGENVLVDCSDMTPEQQSALQSDLASRAQPPGSGQITFTPNR